MGPLDVFFGIKRRGLEKNEGDRRGRTYRHYVPFGILDPRKIGEIGHEVSDDKILASKWVCPTPEDLIKAIESYIRVGATHIDIVTNS